MKNEKNNNMKNDEKLKKILKTSIITFSVLTTINFIGIVGSSNALFTKSIDSKNNIALKVVSYASKGVATTSIENLSKKDTINLAYDGTTDNNLRYIGKDPNNYVTFNNELWRIIGVFTTEDSDGNTEQRIKLIRNEKLPTDMAWNNKDGWNSTNEWTTATLNTYLNTDYYNSLTATAKNMIDNVKYYLGGSNTSSVDGASFYNFERGITVARGHSTNWIGLVGLMYPSDYVYTYALGVDNKCYTDGYTCNVGNKENGWIYNTNGNTIQWMLNPIEGDSLAFFVIGNGTIDGEEVRKNHGIRPALYLNPNVEIESGNGSIDSPYVFKL